MEQSLRCRGMRDLLPGEMRRFREVERAFREVCLGWGYEEVRTPTLEHLFLFTAAGTLSPQMLGRVYSFLDWDGWSGERVVLRPDSTIPTARLYVEQMSGRKVARLFYVQNVFRFAEGDESREDWQCGAELIGDTQPQGDIQLILMGCEALERLGLRPQVRLSHPGIVRAVLARAGFDPGQQLALYDRILDGDLSALDQVQSRLPEIGVSLQPILSGEGEGLPYLRNLASAFVPAIPELDRPLQELMPIASVLAEIGHPCRVAAALVRNFEYYTGPVFQFAVEGRPVGGGGRYDSLIALVGETAVPASGFMLDASLLLTILPEPPADAARAVSVRPASAQAPDLAAAFRLSADLRRRGWAVRVAADSEEPATPWQVVAGRQGFTLRRRGKADRRLGDAAAALRALEEAARD